MFLIDTNIFLEILLRQGKNKDCKSFLDTHQGICAVSDFSLHSIGIILFRYGEEGIFPAFARDIFSQFTLLTLPNDNYGDLVNIKRNHNVDFDDAYQYCVAKVHQMNLVTMDDHFKRFSDIKLIFL